MASVVGVAVGWAAGRCVDFMPTRQIVKRGLSNLQPEQSQEFVVECPSQTHGGQGRLPVGRTFTE